MECSVNLRWLCCCPASTWALSQLHVGSWMWMTSSEAASQQVSAKYNASTEDGIVQREMHGNCLPNMLWQFAFQYFDRFARLSPFFACNLIWINNRPHSLPALFQNNNNSRPTSWEGRTNNGWYMSANNHLEARGSFSIPGNLKPENQRAVAREWVGDGLVEERISNGIPQGTEFRCELVGICVCLPRDYGDFYVEIADGPGRADYGPCEHPDPRRLPRVDHCAAVHCDLGVRLA